MRLNNFAVNSPLSIWVQRSSNDRMFSLQPTPLHKSRHLLKFSSSLLSPLPESSAELSTNGAKNHVKVDFPKSSIAIPGVIKIDEDIYNKMYPNIFKTIPKRKRLEYYDDPVDYDIDSEDHHWLVKRDKCSADQFEQVIEFLEKNSLQKVPSLDELIAQDIVNHLEAEEIYDYWLNKRLKTRQKMLFDIKRRSDNQKISKKNFYVNPYIVFRRNNERMHTRKNRLKDNEYYLEMLQHRKELAQFHEYLKKFADDEKKKLEELKFRFKSVCQWSTSDHPPQCRPTIPSKLNLVSASVEKADDEQLLATSNPDPVIEVDDFTVLKDSNYLRPTNSHSGVGWSSPKPEDHKKFCTTTQGLMRRRVGRGGRIIFDRQHNNRRTQNLEYKIIDIDCYVKCKKMQEPFDYSPWSTSKFLLKNSSV